MQSRLELFECEMADLSAKLSQSIGQNQILSEHNERLENLKVDYENQIRHLNAFSHENSEKIENSLLVKSKFEELGVSSGISTVEVDQLREECKSLKERLESTQQQNLKLKAKLKNVISANKNEKVGKQSQQVEDSVKSTEEKVVEHEVSIRPSPSLLKNSTKCRV